MNKVAKKKVIFLYFSILVTMFDNGTLLFSERKTFPPTRIQYSNCKSFEICDINVRKEGKTVWQWQGNTV